MNDILISIRRPHTDNIKSLIKTTEVRKDKPLYAWHISNLKIYNKPKELSEFNNALTYKGIRCKYIWQKYSVSAEKYYNKCERQNCICEFKRLAHQTDCEGYEPLNISKPLTRPPQSWCYVEAKQ